MEHRKIEITTPVGVFTSEVMTLDNMNETFSETINDIGDVKKFAIVNQQGEFIYFGPELLKNSVIRIVKV